NKIATRAGISIGSLYQYFSSKEEIFEALVKKYFEDQDSFILKEMQVLIGLKLSMRKTVEALLSGFYEFTEGQPRVTHILKFSHFNKKSTRYIQKLDRIYEKKFYETLTQHPGFQNVTMLKFKLFLECFRGANILVLDTSLSQRERDQAKEEVLKMTLNFLK
ncbi:TetR/AcrR family transcriptional regulator, partial [Bacteriovoracaceae bacterium]|nr:TetR/AcrR family transcriptional regulator [Bacteriovoracaceae bacterium]